MADSEPQETDAERAVERMVWTGVCGECQSLVAVWPSDEVSADEQERISETWPRGLAECPVDDCEGTIDWNGNDFLRDILAPRML